MRRNSAAAVERHVSARPLQPVVIWFGRVGDMIMLSALLEILHRRFGNPCVVVGAGEWTEQVCGQHPDVAEALWIRRYAPFLLDARWWHAVRVLAHHRDDPVYVCETMPRKLARVRLLLRAARIDPAHCVFIGDHPESLRHVHVLDQLISLGRLTPRALKAADYPWPQPPAREAPMLPVTGAARAAFEQWAAARSIGAAPLVLLQPGNRRTMRGSKLKLTGADERFWPIERWVELIHRIHARLPAARIVLCGAPRESLLLDWIERDAALPKVMLRGIPIPGLFGLCAAAHSMVSIDTGPAHAAAALGLPLVVLFGRNPPEMTSPRSPTGSPVLCVGGGPQAPRVDLISVDAVYQAWSTLLAARRTA
jgi:ADP-heptose:LPS heptosyltransferase